MNKVAPWLLALLVLGAAPALAEEASAGVAWSALDEPSQALLAGQKDRWDSLPPERQRAMADGAKRWLEMDGIGRAQANERWQHWRSLTPEQRERLRKGWQRFRELPPEKQEALRKAYQRFKDLPPERREALRDRWQQMSPEERRHAHPAPPGREARIGGPAALPALLRTRIRRDSVGRYSGDGKRTAQALA